MGQVTFHAASPSVMEFQSEVLARDEDASTTNLASTTSEPAMQQQHMRWIDSLDCSAMLIFVWLLIAYWNDGDTVTALVAMNSITSHASLAPPN